MKNVILLLLAMAVSGCGDSPPLELMGAYRLEDSRVVSIRRSEGATLRYRIFQTGESGRLHAGAESVWEAGAGFADREPVAVRVEFAADRSLVWTPVGAAPMVGQRCTRAEPVAFTTDGATLRGRLILPLGPGPFPAVVLIHGSGKDSAVEYFPNGDFLAAAGVAALVYDKRGTGGSGGDFTFDFRQLARDVSAAVDVLAEHENVDASRLGVCGYSQGAWVGPLAAGRDSRIRFAALSYGMIESPTDEAVWETQDLLRSQGTDEAGVQEATPLIRAAVAVVAADFQDGWDTFFAQKRATAGASWRDDFGGNPVGRMLSYPKWLGRLIGPRLAPQGLDWNYSSDAVLDELEIPMTWLLAADDASAPNHETIPKLRAYHAAGKPYALIVFPQTDHGMLHFEKSAGTRTYTGYAPGYFTTETAEVLRMSTTPVRPGR